MEGDERAESITTEADETQAGGDEGEPLLGVCQIIDKALHAYRDRNCIGRLVPPLLASLFNEVALAANTVFDKHEGRRSDSLDNLEIMSVANANALGERLSNFDFTPAVFESLFLGLFATFDTFTGDLLRFLYDQEPKLYLGLSLDGVSGPLAYSSIEELRCAALERVIDGERRKSYVEQFESLEKRFGFSTLRKFDQWDEFAEMSQRRNLIAHCGGVVSDQYLSKTNRQDQRGVTLTIDAPYFKRACTVMCLVTVMLGHTLSRKLLPQHKEALDRHLNGVIFDCLNINHYKRAIELCKFAKVVDKEPTELDSRIRLVNMCIALKFSKREEECVAMLRTLDWSSCHRDFLLATEVLQNDFDSAAISMRRIGKKGELIYREAYITWPLFKEFRESNQFKEAYKEIYGQDFEQEVDEDSAKAVGDIAEHEVSKEARPFPRRLELYAYLLQ